MAKKGDTPVTDGNGDGWKASCRGDESEMQYENMTSSYWTDSKAVIGFINNSSRRFRMFVAN